MASYQTPETILRSAEEYLGLSQKESAFNLLIDYMTGKKNRQWSQALEKIMILIIDLALEFHKKELLREPISNYKYASQYNNISSVEYVLTYFLKTSEEKWEAVAKLASQDISNMEDLENEEPVELFILALDVDSRTEKSIIRDAMKNIWETYKMIIEATSKNKKLEDLYSTIIHKCFEFCKKYNRRTEFKRLCEMIRFQLNSIIRSLMNNPDYSKIPFAIDLANLETNEKQIMIRFDQLEYIYEFELWQEAIKTLEDIHHIMQKRRASVKPKILSDYFENLAKIFWKSEFFHYSTVAFFNHYSLLISKNKNISSEELAQKSCTFVLSVLCIPPLLNESLQSEDTRSRATALLSSGSTIPSKQELIIYINKHNILDLCTPEIREIYFLIEENKNIVGLSKNCEPLLKSIVEKYGIFHKQLQNIIIYKLLMLLSKLYTKIKIDNFTRFLGTLDASFCEHIIHIASASDYIKVRIDHKRRLLIFQDDVQDMQNISLKFVNFSEDLKEVIYSIDNKREQTKEQKIVDDLRTEARRYADSARVALNKRMKQIQDMKKLEREFVKPRVTEERERVTRPTETTRTAATEKPTTGVASKQRIEDNLRAYLITRKANLIKKLKGIKGFKIGKRKIDDMSEEDLEAMTLDALEEAQNAWEKKEKERDENAIKNAFKRADHLERAKREEHMNLLKKNWEQNQGEKEEINRIHKENFEKMLEYKNKMKKAEEFRRRITQKIRDERTEQFEEEIQEFREKIIEDFKGKLLELAKESLKAQQEEEEAERKKREEEVKKDKERLESERQSQANTQKETFQRNIVRGEDMRKQAEETKPSAFQRGTERPAEEKKTPGFTRSEKPLGTTGGFSRSEVKKEETKETTESSGPRKFFSSKRETTDSKPAESTTTDDGWRTTKKPETKATTSDWRTTEKPSISGFQRGSGTTSGGPPKFTKGPTPGQTETKPSTSTGAWRKAN